MRCYECKNGTIRKRVIKQYNARLKGINFLVEDAKIEECDKCHARSYSAKEIRRWEKILKKLGK